MKAESGKTGTQPVDWNSEKCEGVVVALMWKEEDISF